MGGHRLSGPHWANLIGGVIANGKDEIKFGCVGFRKFLPTLAAIATRWKVGVFKLPQCLLAYPSCRMTASAVSGELRVSLEVHDPLSHD